MTENLLHKLEEKMMQLLSEVEDLRKEVQHLNHENAALKGERENHARKLQDLISLLDAVNTIETMSNAANLTAVKPMLLQEAVQEQAS
jgi:regulator of replication initiation timing